MAKSLCFTSVCSFSAPNKPGAIINDSIPRKVLRVNEVFKSSRDVKFQSFEAKVRTKAHVKDFVVSLYGTGNDKGGTCKAADKSQSTQSKSIVCPDCEANGSKQCPQCEGTGVNAVDHFNGRFKAGGLCWLCRGKREILCGNCNGAGFLGGFMSS